MAWSNPFGALTGACETPVIRYPTPLILLAKSHIHITDYAIFPEPTKAPFLYLVPDGFIHGRFFIYFQPLIDAGRPVDLVRGERYINKNAATYQVATLHSFA